MPDPVWLPCAFFPDRYEVSDQGQVRVRARVVRTRDPHGNLTTRTLPSLLLAIQYGGRTGTYPRVRLCSDGDRKGTLYSLHTVVCSTFHGARPDGLLCCHKDDDQENNKAKNLYWGTPEQNQADKARNRQLAAGGCGEEGAEEAVAEVAAVPNAGADIEIPGCDW